MKAAYPIKAEKDQKKAGFSLEKIKWIVYLQPVQWKIIPR